MLFSSDMITIQHQSMESCELEDYCVSFVRRIKEFYRWPEDIRELPMYLKHAMDSKDSDLNSSSTQSEGIEDEMKAAAQDIASYQACVVRDARRGQDLGSGRDRMVSEPLLCCPCRCGPAFKVSVGEFRHFAYTRQVPVDLKLVNIVATSETNKNSYESSGHYVVVLAEIEKLSGIIPLYLQAYELLQQSSEILDYGLYIVIYAECLYYGKRVPLIEFNPNILCTRYAALLWDYGMRKQEASAHSDVEEPLRLGRHSRINSVTEVLEI
ncbi:hypothetical protein FXO38_27209 [Capsicum annuum]|nr:hypothetical protein FXO38_27209 [Capsicum annuum]